MSVANEGSVLCREESMTLGMSQVGSMGPYNFDHKNLILIVFAALRALVLHKNIIFCFVYIRCITAGEVG